MYTYNNQEKKTSARVKNLFDRCCRPDRTGDVADRDVVAFQRGYACIMHVWSMVFNLLLPRRGQTVDGRRLGERT